MKYKVTHRTTYTYNYPVSVGNHIACLRPRSFSGNVLLGNQIVISPPPADLSERTDYFGNTLCFFAVQQPHKELIVESRSEVTVDGNLRRLTPETPPWELAAASLTSIQTAEGLDAYQYQFDSPRIHAQQDYAAYAHESFLPGRPMREALLDLTQRIFHDFKFDSTVTTVRTPTEDVFRKRRGVCQDFAHMQIACLRSIGIACRYVSGYLRTYPPPGRPRLVGADASHAWISAYCPGHGWFDMDPTNNVAPSDGHVTLAWGRDYGDVSPLRGLILGGGDHKLKVGVDMEPVEDSPSA